MATALQIRQRKTAFLEAFRRTGNISAAARAAGVTRQDVYAWKKRDARFLRDLTDAEQDAVETLDAEAWRRAVQGTSRLKFGTSGRVIIDPRTGEPYVEQEYSDTLLIFLLKSRNPAKYAQRLEVTGKDGGPIELAAVDLRERMLAEMEQAALRLLPNAAEPA